MPRRWGRVASPSGLKPGRVASPSGVASPLGLEPSHAEQVAVPALDEKPQNRAEICHGHSGNQSGPCSVKNEVKAKRIVKESPALARPSKTSKDTSKADVAVKQQAGKESDRPSKTSKDTSKADVAVKQQAGKIPSPCKSKARSRGDRGDLSDDNILEEPLDDEVENWPAEPRRSDWPLSLVHEVVPDPESWKLLVCDEQLRSWMSLKRGHEAILQRDFDDLQAIDWEPLRSKTSDKITRETAWYTMGACRCPYRYGGREVEPKKMPAWFEDMLRRWLGVLFEDFNCVNMNFYRDGSQNVDWHQDDERLFGGKYGDCRIVSISLGGARSFRVARKRGRRGARLVPDSSTYQKVDLGQGDICTMEGFFQKHYIHKVSKCIRSRGEPRINVTCRTIVNHAPECPLHSRRAHQLNSASARLHVGPSHQEAPQEKCIVPQPSSHLSAHEKNFLKAVKKVRAILALEEKSALVALDKKQLEKIESKDAALAELSFCEQLLAADSELRKNNMDLLEVASAPA